MTTALAAPGPRWAAPAALPGPPPSPRGGGLAARVLPGLSDMLRDRASGTGRLAPASGIAHATALGAAPIVGGALLAGGARG